MPSKRVQTDLNDGVYFLTFTVRNWYYVLDRHDRWQVLLDSLRFCQQKKGLGIYAWVFMINHIHLIVSSPDTAGFIRDFKSFTAQAMKTNILATEPNIFHLFTESPQSPAKNPIFHFWEPTNMPLKIESPDFYRQKCEYIHDNPVRRSYVRHAEEWVYSSANAERLLALAEFEG